jgi:hypothetical protein
MKNAKNLSRRRKAKKVARIDEENGDVATVAGLFCVWKLAEKERERKKGERKERDKKRTNASGKEEKKIDAQIAFSHSKVPNFRGLGDRDVANYNDASKRRLSKMGEVGIRADLWAWKLGCR